MLPIANNTHTTIEHWYPLSKSKKLALHYGNYLAACKGGSDITGADSKRRCVCCEAKKADNADIMIDPRNKAMMEGVIYSFDGMIDYRTDTEFDREAMIRDMDKVLCLNGKLDKNRCIIGDTRTQLVKSRRDTYINTQKICLEMYAAGRLSPDWLRNKIESIRDMEHRPKMAGVEIFVYGIFLERLKEKQ